MRRTALRPWALALLLTLPLVGLALAYGPAQPGKTAQAPAPKAAPAGTPAATAPATATSPGPAKPIVNAEGQIMLHPHVWLDKKRGEVWIDGEVCLREGQLEMLVTLAKTKTHESVVAIKSPAYVVHAALLALGAKTGSPAVFTPEYRPAHGTEIAVNFRWTDAAGKVHEIPAQSWARNVRTQQTMKQPFVFAGGLFIEDETTKQVEYSAEQGDFVCVSNFPTAMLDLPVKSSADAADLMFEAFNERIPPVRTPVTVILKPKLAAAPAAVPGKPAVSGTPAAPAKPAVPAPKKS